MIEEALQEAGLGKRESKCYSALVEMGSSKAGDLSKKTKIPTSKIYEILEKLEKKGLVSYVKKKSVKHYQATEPESILNYFEEKKKTLKDAIAVLKEKQKNTVRQSVEMYEGQKALFRLFTDLIKDAKPKEPYFIFSVNEENKTEAIKLFFRNLTIRRKEKKIDTRLLKNIKHYVKEKHTKMKVRFTTFSLPQGMTIFRNSVVIISWVDSPIAIKIDSPAFTAEMKKFFLELWENAKE